MSLRPTRPRRLDAYARPEAFAPRTVPILAKLGYEVRFEGIGGEGSGPADLRIADERRLGELPDDDGAAVPAIALTGRLGATGADSRIVGAVRRPAGLHDLYRLLQQVFEETPRSTPRVPVHLRTRCQRREREWPAALLSLSENGCLLRSPETLPLGTQVHLDFRLPRVGAVRVWAETAYQLLPDLGLVFSALEPAARDAISRYVVDALATA